MQKKSFHKNGVLKLCILWSVQAEMKWKPSTIVAAKHGGSAAGTATRHLSLIVNDETDDHKMYCNPLLNFYQKKSVIPE